MDVLDADGEVVGQVTSGTFSPTLRRGIGLALVRADLAAAAEGKVFVDVRGRREAFMLTRPPFVDTSVRDS